MPAAAALALDGVEVTLGGRRVLDGLSFTAAPGAITALLGPNGAGKTTTIRVLTGLVPVDGGTAQVLGRPAGHPDALARLGLMPQATGAWSSIRPLELLRYLAGAAGRAVSREELLSRVWRMNPRGIETRTVDMHIARLREKLRDAGGGAGVIETVRGCGYRLGADVRVTARG